MVRVRTKNGKKQVFDEIRKIWVIFSPEEQVRQSVLAYLQTVLKVPAGLIGVEYSLSHIFKNNKKQIDIIVFRPSDKRAHAIPKLGLKPWLLVECKAPSVNISNQILAQVVGYAELTRPAFVMVTNGSDTRIFQREGQNYETCGKIPDFG